MTEAELAANQNQSPNNPTRNGIPPDAVDDDLEQKHTPVEKSSSYKVIEALMLFWYKKGDKLYDKIEKFLEKDAAFHNRNNANLLVTAAKALADAKLKAL